MTDSTYAPSHPPPVSNHTQVFENIKADRDKEVARRQANAPPEGC